VMMGFVTCCFENEGKAASNDTRLYEFGFLLAPPQKPVKALVDPKSLHASQLIRDFLQIPPWYCIPYGSHFGPAISFHRSAAVKHQGYERSLGIRGEFGDAGERHFRFQCVQRQVALNEDRLCIFPLDLDILQLHCPVFGCNPSFTDGPFQAFELVCRQIRRPVGFELIDGHIPEIIADPKSDPRIASRPLGGLIQTFEIDNQLFGFIR
jgi:hypothetical protein